MLKKREVTLTLQDAITEAQDQSPAAMSARLSFLQSYWQYRSYKAQFLPSLNLVANMETTTDRLWRFKIHKQERSTM